MAEIAQLSFNPPLSVKNLHLHFISSTRKPNFARVAGLSLRVYKIDSVTTDRARMKGPCALQSFPVEEHQSSTLNLYLYDLRRVIFRAHRTLLFSFARFR